MKRLSIRGASEHNLRGVSLDIPRNAITVFTGVSGSGKSSLVYDTIFREGQRRFLESLSSYARRILGAIERPQVESCDGLSPTVAIDQRTSAGSIRSTVGTMTEIHDHLRLLFARLGVPHCPSCGRVVESQTVDRICDQVLAHRAEQTVMVCAPVVHRRRGGHRRILEETADSGFHRLRIDGKPVRLDRAGENSPLPTLDRHRSHTIEVVYDRIKVQVHSRSRLAESIEKALDLSSGLVNVVDDDGQEMLYSSVFSCPTCGTGFPELEPGLFSFNSPHGACPRCRGLGQVLTLDIDRVMDQQSDVETVADVAGAIWRIDPEPPGQSERETILVSLSQLLESSAVDLDTPWRDLPDSLQQTVLHGAPGRFAGLAATVDDRVAAIAPRNAPAELRPLLEEGPCRRCGGTRLRPEALAVTLDSRTIAEICSLPVADLDRWMDSLTLDDHRAPVGHPILREIRSRLGFLLRVGLPYLSLDRTAASLSGGEAQRVRLASQIGSRLQGMVFVLDEPTVGLHVRDNARLLQTVREMRNRGNTVLVVEHDRDTIEMADHLVDLGPGAGADGGEIVAEGPPACAVEHRPSSTLAYLRRERVIPVPSRRSPPTAWVEILGASYHNLNSVDLRLPLGRLVAITGVSGSGKSSLVRGILEPALGRSRHRPATGTWREVRGGPVHRVVEIDQKPLGRSNRSNPATYSAIFQPIREIFARTPLARRRGYTASRFSFNGVEGRCFRCRGSGLRRIEMEFLPAVEITCEECDGRRYNRETLEVLYRGKSIADVLDMPVGKARRFFGDLPEVFPALDFMERLGLGYLPIGQPASTLSGGEAQRVKLATFLHRQKQPHTLFILDEPTTGLHFDDVRRLLEAVQALVDAGHTVVVIEHNLDVIKSVDHIIDLGPDGGAEGGRIVAAGAPEEVSQVEESHTARALRSALAPRPESLRDRAAARAPGLALSPPGPVLIRGASEHNLRNINVEIPRNRLTVVTGVSGSGKSTLVFDTLFAEGQRRYFESLSTHARRFLGRLRNPRVERIEGLSPSVAVEQRALRTGTHSTVGTVTEIYHHLRLLFARVGRAHCPECGAELRTSDAGRLSDDLIARYEGRKGYILAPLRRAEESSDLAQPRSSGREANTPTTLLGELESELSGGAVPDAGRRRLDALVHEGFSRLLVGADEVRLDAPPEALRERLTALLGEPGAAGHGVFLVVDRVVFNRNSRARIADSLDKAFRRGDGRAAARVVGGSPEIHSRIPTCPHGHFTFETEISPRLFSFNTHAGACPRCEGTGRLRRLQADRLVVRRDRPLFAGALDREVTELVFAAGSPARAEAESLWLELGLDPTASLDSQEAGAVETLLSGESPGASIASIASAWYDEHQSRLKPRVFRHLTRPEPCADCRGSRLRREALQVRIGEWSIAGLTRLPVERARHEISGLRLSDQETLIARRLLEEITDRLDCLVRVGLGYLGLDRRSGSLSGGEAQRIRLASQIGHRMSGVLYILDEPTIGLHPRDTRKLLATLGDLQAMGNTLVVVEHDRGFIQAADHVIDLGPGAGHLGGLVVASGAPAEIAASADSLTGRYLRGDQRVTEPRSRRRARGHLALEGIRRHNLRDLDASIPLGVLTSVTGVSGSGKSTLVLDVLAEGLRHRLAARSRGRRRRAPSSPSPFERGRLASLAGDGNVRRVVTVTQRPIGRSPRSTPATYCGVWDAIRRFYAMLPGSRVKGFGADRFSPNAPVGRCPACKGEGAVLVEMQFLSDVWLPCEACGGARFNRETLAVRYRGRHVGEILQTEVDAALDLFSEHPEVASTLQVLHDVGLGYLQLGQSATTLSGGEAQRLKLATELAGREQDGTLYILDEPTTGLHFDDIRRLLEVLQRLVDGGGTVVVVEHNTDVIAASDHVIDLGPEGGEHGGRIVACGTPEEIAASPVSHTGRCLAEQVASG